MLHIRDHTAVVVNLIAKHVGIVAVASIAVVTLSLRAIIIRTHLLTITVVPVVLPPKVPKGKKSAKDPLTPLIF